MKLKRKMKVMAVMKSYKISAACYKNTQNLLIPKKEVTKYGCVLLRAAFVRYINVLSAHTIMHTRILARVGNFENVNIFFVSVWRGHIGTLLRVTRTHAQCAHE